MSVYAVVAGLMLLGAGLTWLFYAADRERND